MVNFQELKQQYKQCPIEILKRLVGNGKIDGRAIMSPLIQSVMTVDLVHSGLIFKVDVFMILRQETEAEASLILHPLFIIAIY